MRLVVNPKDELSLRRIINEPKRGIGDKTLEKLAAFAAIRNESILEALEDEEVLMTLPSKAYEPVKQMVEAIRLCREEKDNLRVSDIYDLLLVRTGYLKALETEGTIEAEGRIENIMEFKSVIYDYESTPQIPDDDWGTDWEADLVSEGGEGVSQQISAGPTLEGFMEKLTLMAEIDNHDSSLDAVVMMTLHSAKGLEFPVVFMPGMEDGLFPGHRSFDDEEKMEEERRLCYVGMTRAKSRLILSSASVRTLYGRTDYTRESQFMRELDKDLLEGDRVYEKKDPYLGRDTSYGGPRISTGSMDGFSNPVFSDYKPFDVSFAKQETKKAAKQESNFQVGDRVSHPKFGNGVVKEVTASAVVVDFGEEGSKKMAKGIAPLTKIQ